ncbi:hypothetical protein BDZ85DRAFT_96944 [Elsinoe ampelina]|uniref:Uncharacterized protein n=1 Tax=Elsinoe ampelina TaxID=302913 RepID=A0A6A6GEY1_9PEZI|nr:hypothetical protein BDZ85DRAFT_96944 [Elsinoe ampelina]
MPCTTVLHLLFDTLLSCTVHSAIPVLALLIPFNWPIVCQNSSKIATSMGQRQRRSIINDRSLNRCSPGLGTQISSSHATP